MRIQLIHRLTRVHVGEPIDMPTLAAVKLISAGCAVPVIAPHVHERATVEQRPERATLRKITPKQQKERK